METGKGSSLPPSDRRTVRPWRLRRLLFAGLTTRL